MTESTKIDYVSIVQDLRDEADLCRNETATDIADLLDDAASCIVAMKSQFTALRSELAAAQEALKNHLHLDNHNAIVRQLQERAQRAEALAEQNAKDAERYRSRRGNFASNMNNGGYGSIASMADLYDRRSDEQIAAKSAIAGEKP